MSRDETDQTIKSATAFELAVAILQQLPRDLPEDVAHGWIHNKRALGVVLRQALLPSVDAPVKTGEIECVPLTFVGAEEVVAERTFESTYFFREENQPFGIRFHLLRSFQDEFLSFRGLTEYWVPEVPINHYGVVSASSDEVIIDILGGKKAACSRLAHMAQLIRAQPKGQEGALLNNGHPNIFYLEGLSGPPFAVHCLWSFEKEAWRITACQLPKIGKWSEGAKVFSPAHLIS